jgi:hypothetical protein
MAKYDYSVEIIEERSGNRVKSWTEGRVVEDPESKIPSYDVKGVPRLIPVPSFNHTFTTKKGNKAVTLYSSAPDIWEVCVFDPETKKVKPTYSEYAKNWLKMKVKESHERWTKSSGWDKWLPLIMFFLTALILVAGIKFATDAQTENSKVINEGQVAIAQAQADMAASLGDLPKNMALLLDKVDMILTKYGLVNETEIVRPPV